MSFHFICSTLRKFEDRFLYLALNDRQTLRRKKKKKSTTWHWDLFSPAAKVLSENTTPAVTEWEKASYPQHPPRLKNHRETSKQYLTQVRDKHRYSGNPKRKPAHSNPIEDPDDPYDSTAQVFSLIVPDWTSSQDCVGVCMFVCIVAAYILIILICT